MKNLTIGSKISFGFICLCVLLLLNAVISISFSIYTSRNIEKLDVYGELQNNTNELMHILNETRVNAGVFFASHAPASYDDVTKQLMYCDKRLEKLNQYIDNHPDLAGFRQDIDAFSLLYVQWRDGIHSLAQSFDFEQDFTQAQEEEFTASSAVMRRVILQAHEILSHIGIDIVDTSDKMTKQTREFSNTALIVVVAISAVAVLSSVVIAVFLIRSITRPVKSMRDVLTQIGKFGDLRIQEDTRKAFEAVSDGKDETAQCSSELLVLVNRMNEIDGLLSVVADGDLTAALSLKSEHDTIGLAVVKMLENLNQKFGTIADSTQQMNGDARNLSDDSQLLSSGSQMQSQSIANLSDSVKRVSQKTEENTGLARKAEELTDNIRVNARVGTEKMNQMIQATADINASSLDVMRVIKVIDDIAFQTNILALNAAVEAARAGQHGKGFAVVADEVRNLANKSATAAKETSSLIADTTQKAALGASIAKETSASLREIVSGVESSSAIMRDISVLSQEQSTDIMQIVNDVKHVEEIVDQNNAIASRTAHAATDISSQSELLNRLIAQFKLTGAASEKPGRLFAGNHTNEVGMYAEI